MHDVLTAIQKLRIVPVVVLDDASAAPRLADALAAGGLPCAEITFRTAAAADAIRAIAGRPGLLVGAGTVLTVDQAARAIDSGARFLVAPGLNPKVVAYAQQRGIPMVPGVATPSEIEQALDLGLEVVKFFPAEALGGARTLQAVAAPYSMMRFIPTGGITAANLASYLKLRPVLACGGSWMVAPDLLRAQAWDQVESLTKSAVAAAAEAAK